MAYYDKKYKNWRGEVSLGGKRVRQRGFSQKKFAELWEAQQRHNYEKTRLDLPTPDNAKIEKIFSQYLKHAKEYKKPKAYIRDECSVKKWSSFFDYAFIREVEYIEKDTWKEFVEWRKSQDTCRGEAPANRTVNIDLMTIRHIFKWAFQEDLVKSNPFENIRLFREKKPDTPRYFTVDEMAQIENIAQKINPITYKIIAVLVRTGMRSGELCQLKFSDIDFNLSRIVLKTTYTKNSRQRIVPFCGKVKSILESCDKESEFVFTTRNGMQQTTDYIGRRFRTVLNRAGIFDANVHTLRKTYISHMIMAGEDPAKVMEIVGHREWSTITRYLSLSPSYLSDLKELPF